MAGREMRVVLIFFVGGILAVHAVGWGCLVEGVPQGGVLHPLLCFHRDAATKAAHGLLWRYRKQTVDLSFVYLFVTVATGR